MRQKEDRQEEKNQQSGKGKKEGGVRFLRELGSKRF